MWRMFLVRVSVLVALCCSIGPVDTAAQTPPAKVPPAQQPSPSALIAWLECVECSGNELKEVAALGDGAVPELRGILLNGPQQSRLATQRQHWLATYRKLKEYEQRRPERRVQMTEQQYMQAYEQKFVLLNRSRAAAALGAIRTTQALTALREVLKTDLPPELQDDVARALKGVQ